MTLLDFIKRHIKIYNNDQGIVLYENHEFQETDPTADLFLHNLLRNLDEYYIEEDFTTVEAGLEDEPESLLQDIVTAAYLTYNNTTYNDCPKRKQYVKTCTYIICIGLGFVKEYTTDIDLR